MGYKQVHIVLFQTIHHLNDTTFFELNNFVKLTKLESN